MCAILLHDETKKVMKDVFADFFEFGNELAANGLPENANGLKLMPVHTLANGDMSLLNKCTG